MSAARDLCHLWRRAAFGAAPHDLRRSLRQGYTGTVDELVGYGVTPPPDAPPPFTTTLPPGVGLGLLEVARVIQWWLQRMVRSSRPLEEKLTLFWHGHFTTSVDPVFFPGLLLAQNETLRAHAGGRFADLLGAVVRDPAMLVYLDGHLNRKAHPNENFARELLELFTLGEGHYGERDVREVARAFTGWSVDLVSGCAVFDPEQHDDGPKRVLGHTGQLGADDVVAILAAHPQTARHVGGRLFRFFVDRDPSPPEQAELAAVFTRHRGTTLAVVRHVLLSDAFREAARARESFKSPVETLVSALRLLGCRDVELDMLRPLLELGQLPLLPPSVKGWPDSQGWLDTTTLLGRIAMARRLAERCERPALRAATTRHLLREMGLFDARRATRRLLDEAVVHDRLALAIASPDFQLR